jgi:hypothetical protein
MSRPRPKIILEDIDENMSSFQVVEADAIYTVYYGSQAVGVKANRNIEIPQWQGWKYLKTSFPNPGHAFNLAEKLNQRFKTDLFVVRRMEPGRIITENKQALL